MKNLIGNIKIKLLKNKGKKILIIVRRAGDLATGIIYRLYKSGFKILALEDEKPGAIRRSISFSEYFNRRLQRVNKRISRKSKYIGMVGSRKK